MTTLSPIFQGNLRLLLGISNIETSPMSTHQPPFLKPPSTSLSLRSTAPTLSAGLSVGESNISCYCVGYNVNSDISTDEKNSLAIAKVYIDKNKFIST